MKVLSSGSNMWVGKDGSLFKIGTGGITGSAADAAAPARAGATDPEIEDETGPAQPPATGVEASGDFGIQGPGGGS